MSSTSQTEGTQILGINLWRILFHPRKRRKKARRSPKNDDKIIKLLKMKEGDLALSQSEIFSVLLKYLDLNFLLTKFSLISKEALLVV
jgi:hypothetical protein